MNRSIKDFVSLQEVADAVNEVWYSYAEGYLPTVTGTETDDSLYQIIDDRMPNGWTASIQPSGSVYASRPILSNQSMRVLVVEKRADGHQHIFEVAL